MPRIGSCLQQWRRQVTHGIQSRLGLLPLPEPRFMHVAGSYEQCEIPGSDADGTVRYAATYFADQSPLSNRGVTGSATLLGTVAPKAPGARVTEYNDVWGYQAPDGHRYGLLGSTKGFFVVDLQESPPKEVGFFPGPTSKWRDIKVWGHYAYGVTEGRDGGVQVIDLADPANPKLVNTWRGISTAHNVWIDNKGFLYLSGVDNDTWFNDADANRAEGNLHPEGPLKRSGIPIIDLNKDPVNLVKVGHWDGPYSHDVYIDTAREVLYSSGIDTNKLYVIDVRDRTNPKTIAAVPGDGPNHSGWATEDGNILVTNDEEAGGHVRVWDVSNPAKPVQLSKFRVAGESPHNVIVRNNRVFISYYNEGLMVLDISNPREIRPIAQYDTNGSSHRAVYNGAWGVYLFDDGEILISDIENGIFHLRYQEQQPPVPAP